ncbi:hypothetical protein PO191_27550, partial [Bacteroides ovatus]
VSAVLRSGQTASESLLRKCSLFKCCTAESYLFCALYFHACEGRQKNPFEQSEKGKKCPTRTLLAM